MVKGLKGKVGEEQLRFNPEKSRLRGGDMAATASHKEWRSSAELCL